MVITDWSNGQVAMETVDKIASIRQQASEEFDNSMISSHADETFVSN